MKNLKLTLLGTLLASQLGYAAAPCNGFEIHLKNNLSDKLFATKTTLSGASLNPSGIQAISAKGEVKFTVNNSVVDQDMHGEMQFNTVSLPSKKVTIKFSLQNKSLYCGHEENDSQGDVDITHIRLPGKVNYKIG